MSAAAESTGQHDLLLHITTGVTWRMALAAGELMAPSSVTDGFVHLSGPAQVALPANRLYAGRDDLLLLVIDPARLRAEVRWEPGVPTDPASMRFPHLYGPLPVSAVTSVVPWRPGADGTFTEPTGLPAPTDLVGRARAFDPSLVQRRAVATYPVTGGFAVVEPRFPQSWVHNSCWLDGPATVAAITADAEILGLAGCTHRRVIVDDEVRARALADAGWIVDEERLMVLDADAPTPDPAPQVHAVATGGMFGLWARSWADSLEDLDEEGTRQLLEREALADAVVRIVDLGVAAADGRVVAGAQLRIDGASAVIEAVMTDADERGQGHGRAVVGEAIRRAREAGCDLIWLLAMADDWPREWYARLGFTDAGPRWTARIHTT